jgi:two-component system nitrate/nitrite response regulator NarL
LRILLADDHTLFREALLEYIERAEPEAVILLARDVHDTMELLQSQPAPDIVLLDMRMPGMNGLQGLEKIRQAYPDIPVALLSGLAEKEDVERALALGAAGYFPKTLSGKALLAGIRQVIAGGQFVPTDYNTNAIMPSYRADVPAPAAGAVKLTVREKQVLNFVMRGDTNKDIAHALKLQIVTVKLHVRSLCRKLGAKNRTQAAMIAREKGL